MMMSAIRIGLLLLLALMPLASAIGQSAKEIAYPIMRVYADKEYKGSKRNYAIASDNRGLMYFGNESGIMEFDGSRWRIITVPPGAIVRALSADGNGRIYVGLDGGFGYLAPDSTGSLEYISLSDGFTDSGSFGSFQNVYCSTDATYFVSLNRLFAFRNGELKETTLPSPLLRNPAFYVNGQLYLTMPENGLNTLDGNAFHPVFGENYNEWLNEGIYALLPLPDKRLLLARKFDGLMAWNGTDLKAFNTPVDKYLKENLISGGLSLPDGNIAITTLRGGIVLLTADGKLNKIFNKESGLPDNTINAAYVDAQMGLWLATDNGLVRISLYSPVYLFTDRSGLQGNVNSIVRHNGVLYVSTTQGIYYLKDISNADLGKPYFKYHSTFTDISGFYTEFHDMISNPKGLLVATTDGVYNLQNNIPTRVINANTHFLVSHPSDSNVVFAGLSDSLVALKNVFGKWERHPSFKAIPGTFTSMVITRKGIWAATQNDGLMYMALKLDDLSLINVEYFTMSEGLPSNGLNKLFLMDGKLIVSTIEGVYQFDESTQRFYPSSLFGSKFKDENKRLISMMQLSDSAYFVVSNLDKGIAKNNGNGSYEISTRAFNNLADRSYTTIFRDKDGLIWLGGNQGLVRIASEDMGGAEQNFQCLIRRVQLGEGEILFDGTYFTEAGNPSLTQNPLLTPTLSFNDNALRFEFGASSYELPEFTEYQYQLVGFDHDWSEWTSDTRKDYTNLPEGNYVFKVRARNAFDQLSPENEYRFSITPPWYRTWWAYLAVFTIIALLIYVIIFMRSRQLRKEKRRLEDLVSARTQELKESQDRLVEQQKLASLGQLTAGIAHEIKNPLNFVNNFAELSEELVNELEDELKQQPIEEKVRLNVEDLLTDLRHNVQKINEHGKRADGIVKGMLLHSRNQGEEKETIDLNKMVEENVNLAYHGLRSKQQGVTVQFSKLYNTNIPPISVVKQDISRVILNIANNAIYAAFKKKQLNADSFVPMVTIGTKMAENMVQVIIRDNGTGISKEHLSKIFDPFFTTKPTGEGTGLGLSISYEIVVKGHGGKMEVNSEEGVFTEFIITLPV